MGRQCNSEGSQQKKADTMSDFLDRLIRMENKIDKINDTLADAVTDIALNKQCYHALYGALETHKVESCVKVAEGIKEHNKDEHDGMGGRILGYVCAIIGALAVIIAGAWALATYVIKQ